MFMPSAIAAAAGGAGSGFTFKAALCNGNGGFIGSFPAGWVNTRTAEGKYTFQHTADPATCGVVTMEDAANARAHSVAVNLSAESTFVFVETNRSLDNGVEDANWWMIVFESVGEFAVQYAEVEANGGTFKTGTNVPPVPDGWSISKSNTGIYEFDSDVTTDPRTAETAFAFTPLLGQSSGALATASVSGADGWLIYSSRNSDNGIQDRDFYITAIYGDSISIKGALVQGSNGSFIGSSPAGWEISRSSAGIYLFDPNYGVSMDPRDGNFAVYSTPQAAQNQGGIMAQSYNALTVDINTHRASDGGVQDKNFYLYTIELI